MLELSLPIEFRRLCGFKLGWKLRSVADSCCVISAINFGWIYRFDIRVGLACGGLGYSGRSALSSIVNSTL